MTSLDFIVRIYRFEENNPRSLVGIVEEVGLEGKKAFQDIDELWNILSSRRPDDAVPPPRSKSTRD